MVSDVTKTLQNTTKYVKHNTANKAHSTQHTQPRDQQQRTMCTTLVDWEHSGALELPISWSSSACICAYSHQQQRREIGTMQRKNFPICFLTTARPLVLFLSVLPPPTSRCKRSQAYARLALLTLILGSTLLCSCSMDWCQTARERVFEKASSRNLLPILPQSQTHQSAAATKTRRSTY